MVYQSFDFATNVSFADECSTNSPASALASASASASKLIRVKASASASNFV